MFKKLFFSALLILIVVSWLAQFDVLCIDDNKTQLSKNNDKPKTPDKKSEKEKPEGIASKYPGDKGIEKDKQVVFVEDFEEKSIDAMKKRWEEVKNKEIMSFSKDAPKGSAGKQSLLMTHIGGKNTGGHLYRCLKLGYDQLYIRFYVKFDEKCYPIHHFVHVGGYNPSTRWPQGGAGEKPTGDKRFTTGIEPFGKAWRWDFYSYWMQMRNCPSGKHWGNDFINDKKLKVEKNKWICVELMMKMNDPVNESNGEQSLWINGKQWKKDGQLISHLKKGSPKGKWVWDSFLPNPKGQSFEGFQWRNNKKLNLNFLWILLYITKATKDYVSKVWFDQIVVAKKYIGPIKTKKK